MKLIETKIPNIYGVKVPIDATELELICLDSMYLRIKTNSEYQNIKLEFGTLENINILGTLTKDEISFDASDVVDKSSLGKFKNYKTNKYTKGTAEYSFRSALPREIKQNEKLLILQKI